MTSLVPGLENRQLQFLPTLEGKKFTSRAGPELEFENYESVQHRLHECSGIKKGAKISFHRHFKSNNNISVIMGTGCNFIIFSSCVNFETSQNRYVTYRLLYWDSDKFACSENIDRYWTLAHGFVYIWVSDKFAYSALVTIVSDHESLIILGALGFSSVRTRFR